MNENRGNTCSMPGAQHAVPACSTTPTNYMYICCCTARSTAPLRSCHRTVCKLPTDCAITTTGCASRLQPRTTRQPRLQLSYSHASHRHTDRAHNTNTKQRLQTETRVIAAQVSEVGKPQATYVGTRCKRLAQTPLLLPPSQPLSQPPCRNSISAVHEIPNE